MPCIENTVLNHPKDGNIQLIVLEVLDDDSPAIYLEIPIQHITPLCLRPKKYLKYLGWTIMGVEGHVERVSPNPVDNIGDEGGLENTGVYRYRTPALEEGIYIFPWSSPHF